MPPSSEARRPGAGQDGGRSLRSGFLRAAARWPDRPALEFADGAVTYAALRDRAAAIAATLDADERRDAGPPLTAVLGHRSATAFAGLLGALLRGHGYVPLNPNFPPERTRRMLERAECRALVVDAPAAATLEAVLAGIGRELFVVLPDCADPAALAARLPGHRVLGAADLRPAAPGPLPPVDADAIAYLMFTSGSTGEPKGVMVAHRNVLPFVGAMVGRYAIHERDRFSHTFDLTFDLSVFDMFVAWECGACLCVPTAGQKALPGRYLADARISVWFSVPSTAVLMSRLRMLQPDRYPDLRWSLFCGEALPMDVVARWSAAAPGSIVENLYGPTELTVACTLYRWRPGSSEAECELGLVPIGDPYPGMEVLIADEALRAVPDGEAGELLMTGPQLTPGYWRDPARTQKAFVTPPGHDRLFYRTGDRVRRPGPGRPLVYLGRIDNQVKIQGYRVELGEVEAVLREVAGVEVAVAVGWPATPSGAEGIVAFVGDASADGAALRQRLVERLPPYMHPKAVVAVGEWPLNANGKVDRHALVRRLEDGAAG